MVDFSTTYRPPGVYVEEVQTPIVPTVGTSATVVAIVGPSRDYRIFSETVALTGVTAVPLTKKGVIVSSVVVQSLDGATTYVVVDDYVLVTTVGVDTIASTDDDPTTIKRAASGSDIASPSTVRVTYRYADAAFYTPASVSDFEDVKDLYGQPFDTTTGAILSPLSMAAKLAFDNGARQLILLAVPGTALADRDDISAAYGKLSSLSQVGIVVPLPVGITGTSVSPGDVITTGTDLATACTNATLDGFGRIGIYGVETTVSIDAGDIATGIDDARVVLAWPNRMMFFNSFSNSIVEVAGYYLAAAYAGRLAAFPEQMPLTRKPIRGFSGIPSDVLATMTQTVKNAWSDSGVAVTELTRQRQLVVRHGTSTDPTNVLTREISVTRAKDKMIATISDALESTGLIGSPILPTTVLQVKGIVTSALEQLTDAQTIYSYRDVKGRIVAGDPQVVEIKFEWRPAYPLNYIVVSFSIDTSTGETDFTESVGAVA